MTIQNRKMVKKVDFFLAEQDKIYYFWYKFKIEPYLHVEDVVLNWC